MCCKGCLSSCLTVSVGLVHVTVQLLLVPPTARGCCAYRYIVGAGEPQATFTGSQQRAGVYALPFAVDGLFGFGRPRPPSKSKHRSKHKPKRKAKKSRAAARAKAPSAGGDGGSNGGGLLFGATDESEELPAGYSFDWEAYRSKFGDTPIEKAVTILFSEYASLYSRIAGWTTSSTAPPMSLTEGRSIADQAENFVINIMSPILGFVQTSKVHKLLAHVMDVIRFHGNLRHGNTADNEAAHKDDKPFYRRKNMNMSTYAQQLVRQAQGSRAVVAQHDVADATARRTLPLVPAPHKGGAPAAAASDGEPSAAATAGGTPSPAAAAASTEREAVAHRPAHSLKRCTIGELSRRPGLHALGQLFSLPSDHKVPVLATVEIEATFDCQTHGKQLLRASPKFMTGEPWYDAVFFTVAGSATHGSGVTSDDGEADVLLAGEVRAIIRCKEADYAVICEMAVVDPVAGCPLEERLCTRFRWAGGSTGGPVIRAVPVHDITRVVHMVPDFNDLAKRKGMGAAPATYGSSSSDRGAMRYYLNEFYPWQ